MVFWDLNITLSNLVYAREKGELMHLCMVLSGPPPILDTVLCVPTIRRTGPYSRGRARSRMAVNRCRTARQTHSAPVSNLHRKPLKTVSGCSDIGCEVGHTYFDKTDATYCKIDVMAFQAWIVMLRTKPATSTFIFVSELSFASPSWPAKTAVNPVCTGTSS